MAMHIQSLHIDDYKGLHDLTLKDLKRFNILTGDNNSGKTSVMEFISVLENPQSFYQWKIV